MCACAGHTSCTRANRSNGTESSASSARSDSVTSTPIAGVVEAAADDAEAEAGAEPPETVGPKYFHALRTTSNSTYLAPSINDEDEDDEASGQASG